jgi:UDP-glucose 4-epimerase
MKCLVTGGAGFIGSHLVEELLKSGHTVRILDDFSTGSMNNLVGLAERTELVRGDIRNQMDVSKAVDGIDAIFHLAACISVSDSMSNPAVCFDVNVTGTNLLLQSAARAGVKRVVISSSAAVYGDQDHLPIPESVRLKPLSPYGASKQMDEILGAMYTRSFNLPVVCLRYFNVYGPRQNPSSQYAAAVPIFIRKMLDGEAVTIHGDGGQTRDFVYVKDIALANILAATTPGAEGKVMNICGGNPVSILELVNILREIIPNAPAPRFGSAREGDIYHSYGSPNMARKLLKFAPSISFQDGLTDTIKWMRL